MNKLQCIIIFFFMAVNTMKARPADDPFLWLEEVDGEKAMAWVKAHNQQTLQELQKEPMYAQLYDRLLTIYNSKERIALPDIVGNYIYNFWQDEKHERGIWRRTTWNEYAKATPRWETVLNIDSLAAVEHEKWVFGGATWLYPDYDRCLLHLSRGGGDAKVVREFDAMSKQFIKNGFELPEAKSEVSWLDRNTLYVGTDFGSGSMTTSGYPRIAKLWRRGTALTQASWVFQGEMEDMSAGTYVIHTPERPYVICSRQMSFFTSEHYAVEKEKTVKLDLPADVQLAGIFKNQMMLQLKTDWTVAGKTYRQGSLIAIDYDGFLNGKREFDIIIQPDERSSIVATSNTKSYLLVTMLENVKSALYRFTFDKGRWHGEKMNLPELGSISIAATDDFSDRFFITYSDFLTPTSLHLYAPKKNSFQKIKALPAFFNADDLMAEQCSTFSADGTTIPYFMVHKKDMLFGGDNPTLLYGYGGFEISMLPAYSAAYGAAWLEQGGVYVIANIRGGGEFGPQWHQAALKEKRQCAYDDFIAVAQNLINRKVTSPRHLGIRGGSNGGLLVGVMFTERPDLFNAVVCEVPLLDMQRYNKLLAGASWMAEYGNPDIPEEWAFIQKYSPYQNVTPGVKYPKVYFTTTTRDDRVHPGHARKMAAKMESLGLPFYYFENTEGGHSAGSTNALRALSNALSFTYLHKQLK
jgi:prolyl oligopeptidase